MVVVGGEGVLLILILVGQGPTTLAVSVGWVFYFVLFF